MCSNCCPKCGREYDGVEVVRSRHHYLPKRWYGRKDNHETILICRRDHDDLEKIILAEEQGKQLRWTRYYEIVNEFLGYSFVEV